MTLTPPTPLPRPPSPPNGVAMSKELREWLIDAIVDWDTDLVRAVDGLRTSYTASVAAFFDNVLFGQPLTGTVDGANTFFSFPKRIRTLPTGEGQGMLWIGSTLYAPTSSAPGAGQWRINVVSGSTTYPNGQQIELGAPPVGGAVLQFSMVFVVQ